MGKEYLDKAGLTYFWSKIKTYVANVGIKESSLEWGDKVIKGNFSIGDAYFNDFLRANRFAGLRAEGIVIEYSTDAGETWNEYVTTDTHKRSLFTYNAGFYVGGSYTGNVTADNQLRVTIDTSVAGIYTTLRKFMIYVSTNYSQNCKVTIKAAKQSTPDDYSLIICEDTPISGWSGWNIIPCNFTTYGNTPEWQYGRIRFLFTQEGLSDTSKKGGLLIQRIYAYGGVGWSCPSNMALHGHVYRWDGDMNVVFPGYVEATRFYGPVNGNVTGTALNVTGTVAIANGGTGKNTANDAANNLISGLPAWTANPTDDTYFVRQDTGGTSTFGRVKFSTLWNYIKGKFSGTSPITFSNGAIGINTASTSAYGATKLSTSTSSTATDLAATPSAVKTAYDLADTANTTANSALSGVNGNLIYDHTFTISNGVATFTPHVYQKGTEVTSNYAASCFTWKYRLINGTEVSLTTKSDRGCDVTISNMGYGGHVIGIFTPPA